MSKQRRTVDFSQESKRLSFSETANLDGVRVMLVDTVNSSNVKFVHLTIDKATLEALSTLPNVLRCSGKESGDE